MTTSNKLKECLELLQKVEKQYIGSKRNSHAEISVEHKIDKIYQSLIAEDEPEAHTDEATTVWEFEKANRGMSGESTLQTSLDNGFTVFVMHMENEWILEIYNVEFEPVVVDSTVSMTGIQDTLRSELGLDILLKDLLQLA